MADQLIITTNQGELTAEQDNDPSRLIITIDSPAGSGQAVLSVDQANQLQSFLHTWVNISPPRSSF